MVDFSELEFTQLLQSAQSGDDIAEARLFEIIDEELRRIAGRMITDGRFARATSLVNDAYVYLFERIKHKQNLDLRNRRYFFKSVASRMRNILLDRIKKRRPGPWDESLDCFLNEFRESTAWEYEAMHDALSTFLSSECPKTRRRHQLIDLHFFGGMTYASAAAELGISRSQYQLDRDRALAELQLAVTSREP